MNNKGHPLYMLRRKVRKMQRSEWVKIRNHPKGSLERAIQFGRYEAYHDFLWAIKHDMEAVK